MELTNRKDTWNRRHHSNSDSQHEAEDFLKQHLSRLKPGTACDLACGTGRNAIYLATNGFRVTAVDFSNEALHQLEASSLSKNLSINTMEMDLEQHQDFTSIITADNILVVRFKLDNNLLDQIPYMLTDQGIFLYCTFNMKQSKSGGFRSKFCLKPSELVEKRWNMELLKYCSYESEGRYLDGYIFRKTH